MSTTAARAHGRWKEILPAFGIGAQFLVNRHGPCPLCGGRDRYRFDDREGNGTYFCNQCGPGNGFILLQKKFGWDFAKAAQEVDRLIGTDRAPVRPGPAKQDDSAKRLAAIERVMAQATRQDVVDDYLASRGIRARSPALLGHPSLPFFDGSNLIGRFSAIIAPIHGPDGSLQSAHRIYLTDRSDRKKLMPAVRTVKGGAARLFPHGEHLGIAEGIETAMAAREIFGVPTWAAISAGGLEAFEPPATVRHVTIFGDNDANFVGQRAAFNLAERLQKRGISVMVEIPPDPGTDWNDALTGAAK